LILAFIFAVLRGNKDCSNESTEGQGKAVRYEENFKLPIVKENPLKFQPWKRQNTKHTQVVSRKLPTVHRKTSVHAGLREFGMNEPNSMSSRKLGLLVFLFFR